MKKVAIVLIIITGIALIGYTVLGGFKEVPLSREPISGYILAGIPYKGKATDIAFKDLFQKVNADFGSGKVKGTLAAIYYDTSESEKGRVDAFIGAIVADSASVLPDSTYRYKYLAGKEVVRAVITSHPSVAPAPDKLKQRLMEYAWHNQLKPQQVVIEKFFDQRNIQVEIPVKTN